MVEFERKNIRLEADRYIGRQMYFHTLCFQDRQKFGSNPKIATWIVKELRKHAKACEFAVHAYCVMPDHVHMLAHGLSDESDAMKLVESFKQATGLKFSSRRKKRLWQFKHYDHILRASDSPDAVAIYLAKSCAQEFVPTSGGVSLRGGVFRDRKENAEQRSKGGVGTEVEDEQ